MKKKDFNLIVAGIIVVGIIGLLICIHLSSKQNEELQQVLDDYSTLVDKLESANSYLLKENIDLKKKLEYKVMEPLYVWPIHKDDYRYPTSPFGIRDVPIELDTGGTQSRNHLGLDIVGHYMARIVSAGEGVVVDHYLPPGVRRNIVWRGHDIFGGYIKIRHIDGTFGLYAHMSQTYVHIGQKVAKGEIIGRQGSTGLSTGPHLHFELHDKNNNPIQPLLYMKEPEFNRG